MVTEQIAKAVHEEEYQAYGEIIREYVAWCRERYADDVWFVDELFGHQALDQEIPELSRSYGFPMGCTLIVRRDGVIAAAGAYCRIDEQICEVKRVFVRDAFKGQGVGRRLCAALIRSASEAGYCSMRLGTAHRLVEAIALYQSLGFKECCPYLVYPEKLRPYILFMERPLER